MDECWYYLIGEKASGPFTMEQLIYQPGFTPDSLVWKEGFAGWEPARTVSELDEIFKDKNLPPEEPPFPEESDIPAGQKPAIEGMEGDVVVVGGGDKEPSFIFFWLMMIMMTIAYLIYELYLNA